MKTILITGANGLIGKELTATLLEKGYNIIATDKTISPFVGKPNFSYIQCDITDKGKIAGVIEGSKIDALIHLACSADNDFGAQITEKEFETSRAADKYLYKSAIAANIKDIFVLSTTQIYATPKTREPINELAPERPYSNYAKLKQETEKALVASLKKGTSNAIIMRIAPIYTKDFIKNLHSRIYDAKEGIAFLYGEGEYSFTFCCLYNLIDFIYGILTQDGSIQYQGLYNICDSRQTSAKEIVDFEREYHRLGPVIQRNYMMETVKNTFLTANKSPKVYYRYADPSTLTSSIAISNKKALRFATFRWKLSNTK